MVVQKEGAEQDGLGPGEWAHLACTLVADDGDAREVEVGLGAMRRQGVNYYEDEDEDSEDAAYPRALRSVIKLMSFRVRFAYSDPEMLAPAMALLRASTMCGVVNYAIASSG